MKSRCRWKKKWSHFLESRSRTKTMAVAVIGVIGVMLACLVSPSVTQGNRPSFASGQSIVPGGFQPFRQNPNFFTPSGPITSRSGGGGATSVQNTHFGFFPPSGPTQKQPAPSFIGLGPQQRNNVNPAQNHQVIKSGAGGEIQYEYYDEPEDDIIYQYPTDLGLHNHHQKKSQPSTAVVGKGTPADQINNQQHHSRFQQTFTTAQLGSRATLAGSRGKVNPNPSTTVQHFIPLEEPEQPLLALNGRSVQSPSRGNNNIRPPPSLLRPSTNPTTTTTAGTTAGTTATTTTERNRLRVATTRRPQPNPGRNRFSSGTTTTRFTTASTTARSPHAVALLSSSAKPEVVRGGQQHKVNRNKEKYSGDDYTVEYIEYPESGSSPEEGTSNKGGGFDYYEVSEETAKVILENQKKSKTAKPDARVTSSSSVSSSSSVGSSTASVSSSTTTTTTTPAPPPLMEKKAKVVVSISSSKTVSGSIGSISKSTKVSPTIPTPSTTTPSLTITSSTTTTASTTTTPRPQLRPRPTTDPGVKDSLPAGAETSPEYYEEEYSYHEHPAKTSVASVSSSSPPKETEEETQEEGQDDEEEDEVLRHPQPRKLPSKKGEIIPHSAFHTLVDFGDLDSEGRVPLLGDNNNNEQRTEVHEDVEVERPTPSSTTTPTTTTTTTTTNAPVVFGGIKFADISPDLLPPGFNLQASTTTVAPSSTTTTTPTPTTTSTTTTTTTPKPNPTTEGPISFESIPSFLLPKGYKSLGSRVSSPTFATTTTTTTLAPPEPDLGSIPLNLLPKGYKLPSTTASPLPSPTPNTSSSPAPSDLFEAILSKIKFQEIAIPSLIPKDYKAATEPEPTKSAVPANLLPPGFKPSPTESPIQFEIPANLLPPGYKKPTTFTSPSSSAPGPIPTKKPGGLVFPTRPSGPVYPTKPGGFRVTRPTTTEGPKADTPPPPRVTIAAAGWPTRKTTEFTGWPTPSTTRPPPTSPTPPTTTTEAVTTPSTTTPPTTTTTPPPPKRSPLGSCPQAQEVCRMEATIRLTGGVVWKPEFADINTEEYKHLELTVRRELDGAYRASGLAPWYKRVTIEGFNQGSVLVDYFVELDGVDRELTTSDVVKVFHKSLLDSDPGDELPEDAPVALRFGRYSIDPRYTDFKIVTPKTGKGSAQPETLIPQWGIAVIVIGMVSLLFLLILSVIVLVSRFKNSKKKNNVSLTQEMLNEFNKSHMAVGGGGGGGGGAGGSGGGVDNFGADDLYNMDDVWNDKQMDRTFDRRPTKRSQGGSVKGSGANYNIYDSWKTEWNGYFHNGNYYGDSGYAPSRRRSDYDTNF